MAWAVFHKSFNYDFRPKAAVCREFRPSLLPQEAPSAVIEAAERAGAAERVKSPTASQKRAIQRAKRAG